MLSRRGSSRERGIKQGASFWCDHDYPMLVTPTEQGYYARCLVCLAIGPERPSSEEARQALPKMGQVQT